MFNRLNTDLALTPYQKLKLQQAAINGDELFIERYILTLKAQKAVLEKTDRHNIVSMYLLAQQHERNNVMKLLLTIPGVKGDIEAGIKTYSECSKKATVSPAPWGRHKL